MLGANHLLCVFGIGFQLYSQLKKSLYDGMEVLGRSVVLMASQTTRLGKSSSVMVQDKHMPERSNYSEIDLEWILKILLLLFLVIWVSSFFPFFFFQALFVYLIISSVPTCLVHNCETSQRFYYFHLLSPLFVINSLWSLSPVWQWCSRSVIEFFCQWLTSGLEENSMEFSIDCSILFACWTICPHLIYKCL